MARRVQRISEPAFLKPSPHRPGNVCRAAGKLRVLGDLKLMTASDLQLTALHFRDLDGREVDTGFDTLERNIVV